MTLSTQQEDKILETLQVKLQETVKAFESSNTYSHNDAWKDGYTEGLRFALQAFEKVPPTGEEE